MSKQRQLQQPRCLQLTFTPHTHTMSSITGGRVNVTFRWVSAAFRSSSGPPCFARGAAFASSLHSEKGGRGKRKQFRQFVESGERRERERESLCSSRCTRQQGEPSLGGLRMLRDTDKGNQRGKGFQCETEAHPTVSDSKYFGQWLCVAFLIRGCC